MSATLRHDIGPSIAEAIVRADPGILDVFGAKTAERWGGVGKDRWICCTFAIRLPVQTASAYRLMLVCDGAGRKTTSGTARKGCALLAGKLRDSLGLPVAPPDAVATVIYAPDDEAGFVTAIHEAPGDLASWSAYADWLQEHDDARGLLIAGWLGKKAIAVKYGVPLLAKKRRR